MSAKSILSRTSFGTKPTQGLEVIDAYKQGELDKFIQNPTSDAGLQILSEQYPDLKADKLLDIINDPLTQEYLAESGLTLNNALDGIKRNLPSGVDLNSLLGDFDVPFLAEWAEKFKGSVDFNLFSGLDNIDYKSFLTNIKKYRDQYRLGSNWDFKNIQSLWGKAAGVLPRDTVTMDKVLQLANRFSIADKLARTGLGQEIIDWINDDSTLSAEEKKTLFGDLLPSFAESGLWDYIDDLISKGPTNISPKIRKDTVKGLLYGYRLPVGASPSIYHAEAEKLIARLDALDANWDKIDRNGVSTPSMKFMRYASEHTVTILSAHDRTRNMALSFRTFAAVPVSETSLAQRFIYRNAFLQL
ncbi:hypothetical protein [Vibrio phage vB_VmeM-Yong XC32]|nr:hypothetical protein [Vibrio phage vB_VmeM-Yong XC31]QAX96453.1 hypothetical protein [Vibrio phage vB_VmeM-Yong XC32]QAX96770.1 hypothetical protein [Vibrio phage vB_VmeM-Yong MS31]QAX97089.1 hypothetical protein [Vibrio phage vB_VmeM-Yong MS32]